MEKEFVPHQQSIDIRELGFNELCFGFYNIRGFFVPDYKVTKLQIDNLKLEECCLAPTFSQAFDFFREKYGFLGVPNWYSGGFYCYTIKDVTDKVSPELFTEFLTYEEAELECLKKLIEIVKRKKL